MTTDSVEGATRRERLRFVGFDFDRLPNGRVRARVSLEWSQGAGFVGTAEGLGSEAGELRTAAEATIASIEQAVEGLASFELLGVKAVRAFDAYVVIVSLAAHDEDGDRRLVGSYLTDVHTPRGAAIAVLNATNRLLGNIFLRNL